MLLTIPRYSTGPPFTDTTPRRTVPLMRLPFALAAFSAAALLFAVQPMAGKAVLPTFGGSPAVWTACLLFFQAVLLLGYLYAHALGRFSIRTQVAIHAVVLILGGA